jgi:transcriptional regulator with XRE-family HTH domain
MSRRAARKLRAALGARLRALRAERGLTQRELGRRARLSGKFIGEVERGEKSITLDSLYLIARAFRVRLEELTAPGRRRARRATRAR